MAKNYYNSMKNNFEENGKYFYKKNIIPKLFDNTIFSCNSNNLYERLEIVELSEINHIGVYLKNIYNNPFAVRNFISELPHSLNNQTNSSAYPGYISDFSAVNLSELHETIKKIILYKFKYLDFKFNELVINFPFKSALFTTSNITFENTPVVVHKDSDKGLAGVIYLNLPEECDGGTGIYKKNKFNNYKLLNLFKMEFNTMIMYPSHCYHSICLDNENSFSESYRITQRFFINLPYT